jgi:hypothetical protein
MQYTRVPRIGKFVIAAFFAIITVVLSIGSFSTGRVLAQNAPRPSPTPVPCNEIRPTDIDDGTSDSPFQEFHSLRPYQASPCEQEISSSIALFCGNDIILRDSAVISQNDESFTISPPNPGSSISPDQCTEDTGAGTQTCSFTLNRNRSISVDLSQLDLPIAGNTQNVRNITNNDLTTTLLTDEQLTDGQKTNNYISWYLSGVPFHAEYSFPYAGAIEGILDNNPGRFSDGSTEAQRGQTRWLIDYAGPLNKTLPQRIQFALREEQIDEAGASRHDQVVACTMGINAGLLGTVGNFPLPCNTSASSIVNIILAVAGIPGSPVEETGFRLSYWRGSVPADDPPRLPPKEEDFDTLRDYLAEYQEWRGKYCFNAGLDFPGVPEQLRGLGVLLCVNDPGDIFRTDLNAELFPYIPYSSTEDMYGELSLQASSDPLQQEPNVEILTRNIAGQNVTELTLPHLQESEDLAAAMQLSYLPFDVPGNPPASTTDVYIDPEIFPYCQAVEVRDGPLGDSVFAESFDTSLSFQARVTCEFPLEPQAPGAECIAAALLAGSDSPECVPASYDCDQSFGSIGCGDNFTCGAGCDTDMSRECEADSIHGIDVNVDVPLLDSIWSRLVAGPTSVFRRFFPRVGPDGAVTQIYDIPAASIASFTTDEQGVSLSAGDPNGGGSASNAEIYYPHLGGIHEYFLQCLQKTFRPEGPESVGCISATGLSGSLLPRTAISCDTPIGGGGGGGGGGTIPPVVGGTTLTDIQIRAHIAELLNGMTPSASGNVNGATGYETLYQQLNTANGRISTTRMLLAEKQLQARPGSHVIPYLTSAWVWREGGMGAWPDPYEFNCDDGENGADRLNISSYCYRRSTLPAGEDFLIQVAGFQATESRKRYRQAFIDLYGNDEALLRTVLRRVIDNSQYASRTSWMYTHSSQNRELVSEFMTDFLSDPTDSTAVSLSDISESGIPTAENTGITPGDIATSTQNRKTQFFTFMLSKDPLMAIYLNSAEGGGGVSQGDLVAQLSGASILTRQQYANLMYALWLFETRNGLEGSLPTVTQPVTPGNIPGICLQTGAQVTDSTELFFPQVASYGNNVYVSGVTGRRVLFWSKSDTANALGAPEQIGEVSAVNSFNATGITTDTSGNVYLVWNDFNSGAIMVRVRNGTSWGPEQEVISGGTRSLPEIAVVNGVIVVAWSEESRIFYATSNVGSGDWGERRLVADVDAGNNVTLATGNGQLALTFGGNSNIYASVWDGTGFNITDTVISNSEGVFAAPSVAIDPINGTVHVVYYQIITPPVNIFHSVRNGQGNWERQLIATADMFGGSVGPTIASDAQGGLHAFWAAGTNGVMYSYRRPGGTWQAPVIAPTAGFTAEPDSAATISGGSPLLHGVVREIANNASNLRYYLFRVR